MSGLLVSRLDVLVFCRRTADTPTLTEGGGHSSLRLRIDMESAGASKYLLAPSPSPLWEMVRPAARPAAHTSPARVLETVELTPLAHLMMATLDGALSCEHVRLCAGTTLQRSAPALRLEQ